MCCFCLWFWLTKTTTHNLLFEVQQIETRSEFGVVDSLRRNAVVRYGTTCPFPSSSIHVSSDKSTVLR